MSWSNVVPATRLVNITTAQDFLFSGASLISLNPGETAHVQVAVDFPSSPTDHLTVEIWGTPDAGTTYDLVPFASFTILNTLDPSRISFVVKFVRGFKVSVKRSGSTDTITSADAKLTKDGVNL